MSMPKTAPPVGHLSAITAAAASAHTAMMMGVVVDPGPDAHALVPPPRPSRARAGSRSRRGGEP